MAQLDCNVKSCCHNEDNCCCLSSIEVNGSNACNCEDTCCGSYFEDKSGEKNSAQTPHVSLSIACQATNCMYNDDKVCHADHVDISGIQPLTKPSAQLFRKSRKISAKCRFI
jgi:hypothetical protein